MTIAGARVAQDGRTAAYDTLAIRDGRFVSTGATNVSGPTIDLSGYLVLPGLINAHDHLEFNLFPRLGRGPYKNATEWASDIHQPDLPPVREHLAIPKRDRLVWGGIKNLLSGVTTVAHHNPYHADVFDDGFPVRVVKQLAWGHSLHFTPDLQDRYRNSPSCWPFVLHAAEGTDEYARSEIRSLDAMGVLSSRTVLVHAIALSSTEIEILRQRQCSIVWCPSSNLFVYGLTLGREALDSGIPIALGSDSAMTAQGDLTDEIHEAERQVDGEAAYEMVTSRAARILRLQNGEGEIRPGAVADLIAVRDTGESPAQSLGNLTPDLVIVGGCIKLVSSTLAEGQPGLRRAQFHRIAVEQRGEWFIDADVPRLYTSATGSLGPEVRLAGRAFESR